MLPFTMCYHFAIVIPDEGYGKRINMSRFTLKQSQFQTLLWSKLLN